METKTLFFCIALAILALRFTPINIVDMVPYFGFANTVSGIYVIIFLLYILVKNLKEIKGRLSAFTLHLTNKIVLKNDNLKDDAIKFLLVSLLIAFSIDIVLTKLSDKPLWEYAKYVPGIDPILDIVNINETSAQISNLTDQFLNPFPPDDRTIETDRDPGPTTQSIRPFIDISAGAFILFFLRQFIYRNRYVERSIIPKNPGSRLLLLFLVGIGILFVIDIVQDISYNLRSLKDFDVILSLYQSQFPSLIGDLPNPRDPSLYQFANVLVFLLNLTNPFVYVTIISVWAFDWYLFSRVWAQSP